MYERGRSGKERKRRGDGLIEAGTMFNSKKLKTRPANYVASRAINPARRLDQKREEEKKKKRWKGRERKRGRKKKEERGKTP